MIEPLGPNMARSLVGDAYNPRCRYELETAEDGFYIIVTDKETGESSSVLLQPEVPDIQRLEPLWKNTQPLPWRRLGHYLLCAALLVGTVVIMLLCVVGNK